MKTTKTQPSSNSEPASNPKTETAATAKTHTTTATTPKTPPPPQRTIKLYCHPGDGKDHHAGALTSIRAEFDPCRELVSIKARSGEVSFAHLNLDHTQTRAVLNAFKESLSSLARLRRPIYRDSDFGRLGGFFASRHVSECQSPADVSLSAFTMPGRDVVHLTAKCSARGIDTHLSLHLTVLEAEALVFDLERSLGDMERFTFLDL